ncbi:hypothetical protein CXF72_04890 [Psychromonas sp. MB-3u-54]|uniref:hypothetical protein n=1 Tax=Psychromonas sp. MB-3u-54 TaxID=2058319 RepID=UPI000C335612|nr:hypothetical protein [Psychromonas sp. MB-3u-54]PKH03721.1 hypothetical protein CXF72_04890 [Psychromonas sp. MB-3u-54]
MYHIPDKKYFKIKIAHLNLKASWWQILETRNEVNIAQFNEVAEKLRVMVAEQNTKITDSLWERTKADKEWSDSIVGGVYRDWCEAWHNYYTFTLKSLSVDENAPEKEKSINMKLPGQHFDKLQLKVQNADQQPSLVKTLQQVKPPVEMKKTVYIKKMKKLLENVEIATILGENSVLDTKFPHVSHEICCHWGTKTFDKYTYDLILNTRPEPRQGFPKEAWLEIEQLKKYHATKYSSTAKKDVWDFS